MDQREKIRGFSEVFEQNYDHGDRSNHDKQETLLIYKSRDITQ